MARKTPSEFEVEIENLVYGGEGLGYFNSKPVFVYGVLPGEKVRVCPVRVRSKFIKAALLEVIRPAKERRAPRDSHFLTSSPWEIIPEGLQRQLKVDLTKSMWKKIAKNLPADEVKIVPSVNDWRYRNKMEFSFVEKDGKLSLAFHQRYYHNRFYSLVNSALAPAKMNECAGKILDELNKRQISVNKLKNLLMRYSFFEDSCLAVLYVKDKNFECFSVDIDGLSGWAVVYSDPKSPAAVSTEILSEQGNLTLTEAIKSYSFGYSYKNFFQVNPPTFEKIIEFLQENIKSGHTLLDLYAGVGVIGEALSGNFSKVTTIENDAEAGVLAEKNAQKNKLSNIEVISGFSEKQDLPALFKQADCLVVDPPRSGLHPKVARAIRDFGPKNFIYVSCNPSTQARDWSEWQEVYCVKAWRLFDMYPQTPHIESVLIMERQ